MPLSTSTSLALWTTAALALILSVILVGQLDLQALIGSPSLNFSHTNAGMTTIATNSSTPPYPAAYPQLVLFGDSITQGAHSTVIPKLSELYLRRLDVVNRGFSGYNTLHALPILPLLFPSSAPTTPRIALMTVFFGANDAVLPGPDNAQHVSLPDFKSYLRQIADHPGVQDHGTKVIFITPPPIDEWRFPDWYDARNAQNTRLYADACAEVAKEVAVPCVDLWTAFMTRAGWTPDSDDALPGSRKAPKNEVLARLLSDGLHFTDEGYAVFYEELAKVIREQVPDMLPEKLPMVVPDWKVVMGVED